MEANQESKINWNQTSIETEMSPLEIQGEIDLVDKDKLEKCRSDIQRAVKISGLESFPKFFEVVMYSKDSPEFRGTDSDARVIGVDRKLGTYELQLRSDYFDDSELVKNHEQTFKRVLNKSDLDLNNSDEKTLASFIRSGSMAHEVFHLRQNKLGQYYSDDLSKVDRTKRSSQVEWIRESYFYKPEERSARAFETRYLTELLKETNANSPEFTILENYIKHRNKLEIAFSKRYSKALQGDEQARNLIQSIQEKGY